MMILVFAILLFVSVALLALGIYLDRSDGARRNLLARLWNIRRGPALAEVSATRDERFSTMPWLDRTLKRFGFAEHLELLLYQAGMQTRTGVLVMIMAVGVIGGYLLGVATFHRVFPGLVLMCLIGPIPYAYVVFRKMRRMQAFAKEFPDALDLLVTGLRAGLSFPAALQVVADESPEPVRGEFQLLVEEQALGLDFREAMIHLTQRVDVLDLRFFVTAVLLQRETGGNLAEVLSNTATLIRDRFRVLGDIQTFTAQGKMTGLILVCLPVAVGLFTAMAAPEYFRPMVENPAGRVALWWAGGLQLGGILAIMKIVNIKV